MNNKKFNPQRLQRLNDPQRLKDIPSDYIISKLQSKNSDVLVDIGAGTALFSIAFLRQFNPSKIYACDISEIMIEWIKDNVSPEYPEIIPVKTSEKSIPLDNAIADLVFMINLHHELEDPVKIIEEAFRMLKPGGEIFIVDWKKEEMPEGPSLSIRYMPEQIREQLKNAGFKDVEIYLEMQKHFLVTGKK